MIRLLRLAHLLLLLSALSLLLGGGAMVLAAGPEGWADLTAALAHIARGRWLALCSLGGLALVLTVPIVVLVIRGLARTRPTRVPDTSRMRLAGEELTSRARRMLDLEICRSHPDVVKVVDVLLCTPVDLGTNGLSLTPGEMLVEVALDAEGENLPVTSLSPPLYDKILQQLRQMASVEQTGDGVLDLRSSKGAEQILVRLQQGTHGVQTRLQVVSDEGAITAPQEGPLRRRRSNSVVFRIEPPPIRDLRTGELAAPPIEEHEATDPGSGMLLGLGRSGQPEVPRVERDVGATESWLRLALGATLLLLMVSFFWNAYGWAIARAVGTFRAPWREVEIRVVSAPPGTVSIEGVDRGQTPLTFTEPCRGRAIAVLVRAAGHATWQWSGICPASGPLKLSARLQPQ